MKTFYPELHDVLSLYCRYKKYNLLRPNKNIYIFEKYGIKLSTIIIEGDRVVISYEASQEATTKQDFIKYLNEEIEKERQFNRMKLETKPIKTFPLQYVRMKLITRGKEFCKQYGIRQNIRYLGRTK